MNEKQARSLVYARSGGICEACGSARATDYAHRKARSQGGEWSPVNALHVCHVDHMIQHANPNMAAANGWMVRSWADPAIIPARLARGLVFLNEDGTVTPERVAS